MSLLRGAAAERAASPGASADASAATIGLPAAPRDALARSKGPQNALKKQSSRTVPESGGAAPLRGRSPFGACRGFRVGTKKKRPVGEPAAWGWTWEGTVEACFGGPSEGRLNLLGYFFRRRRITTVAGSPTMLAAKSVAQSTNPTSTTISVAPGRRLVLLPSTPAVTVENRRWRVRGR